MLRRFPNSLVTLDLKDQRPAIAKPVCELITRLNRVSTVYVGSDSNEQVVEFRSICPELRTSGTSDPSWSKNVDDGKQRGALRKRKRNTETMQTIETEDFHTAGEPYRIVTSGTPVPEGTTVLDRRDWAEHHLDNVRAFLVNEPRGHGDMYGCFITPPDAPDALGTGAFGMVFFHKDGFSTACGHGTIAGTTWALNVGLIPPTVPVTRSLVDVPSGRLRVEADVAIDESTGSVNVGEVRFENVPSFVSATALRVHAAGRDITVDVSYGGAFYASADVAQLGVDITPDNLALLIDVGRAIKWAINEQQACRHPVDPRLSGCYGTIWYQALGERTDGSLHQRNVTIFADGEVDRSPCGSGSSARLALLDHHGTLRRGQHLHHESVIGSTFTGQVLGDGPAVGHFATVRTVIGGRAHRTGYHRFVLDPADAVGLGFQLR